MKSNINEKEENVLSCSSMNDSALSELRIKNAKDAYVALFNALGPNHYATLKASYVLAMTYLNETDAYNEEAYEHAKNAYENLCWRRDELDIRLIYVAGEYFRALEATGRCEEFLSVYNDVMTLCGGEEQVMYDSFDRWEEIQREKAMLLMNDGQSEEATKVMRHMLKECEEEFGFADQETLNALVQLLAMIRMTSQEEDGHADKEIRNFSSRWKKSGEFPDIRPVIIDFVRVVFSEKQVIPPSFSKLERQLYSMDEYSQQVIYPLIEYLMDTFATLEEISKN